MPQICCVAGCTNRRVTGSSVSWQAIPLNPNQQYLWLKAIYRANRVPSKHDRVCGAHFINGIKSKDPLHPDYVPSLRMGDYVSSCGFSSPEIKTYQCNGRKQQATAAEEFAVKIEDDEGDRDTDKNFKTLQQQELLTQTAKNTEEPNNFVFTGRLNDDSVYLVYKMTEDEYNNQQKLNFTDNESEHANRNVNDSTHTKSTCDFYNTEKTPTHLTDSLVVSECLKEEDMDSESTKSADDMNIQQVMTYSCLVNENKITASPPIQIKKEINDTDSVKTESADDMDFHEALNDSWLVNKTETTAFPPIQIKKEVNDTDSVNTESADDMNFHEALKDSWLVKENEATAFPPIQIKKEINDTDSVSTEIADMDFHEALKESWLVDEKNKIFPSSLNIKSEISDNANDILTGHDCNKKISVNDNLCSRNMSWNKKLKTNVESQTCTSSNSIFPMNLKKPLQTNRDESFVSQPIRIVNSTPQVCRPQPHSQHAVWQSNVRSGSNSRVPMVSLLVKLPALPKHRVQADWHHKINLQSPAESSATMVSILPSQVTLPNISTPTRCNQLQLLTIQQNREILQKAENMSSKTVIISEKALSYDSSKKDTPELPIAKTDTAVTPLNVQDSCQPNVHNKLLDLNVDVAESSQTHENSKSLLTDISSQTRLNSLLNNKYLDKILPKVAFKQAVPQGNKVKLLKLSQHLNAQLLVNNAKASISAGSDNVCDNNSFVGSSSGKTDKGVQTNKRDSSLSKPNAPQFIVVDQYGKHLVIGNAQNSASNGTPKEPVKVHVSQGNDDEVRKCVLCSYGTFFKSLFDEHIETHRAGNLYFCTKCPHYSKTYYYLSKHYTNMHAPKIYECKQCIYSCSTLVKLNYHNRKHLGIPIVCRKCGYKSTTRSKLKKHRLSHNPVKYYYCDQCTFSTKHQNAFTVHMRIHSDDKPYQCSQCDYSTRQNGSLLQHKRRKHAGLSA